MGQHALFSPSSAERWMTCPASIVYAENFPRKEEESSVFAMEGTAAHELAEMVLNSPHKDAIQFLGEPLEGGFTADEEMCDHVQTYVDKVMESVNTHDGVNPLMVEERFSFGEFIGVEEQFGTCDALVLADGATELIVSDLKYGKGLRVYAKENKQLMLYALGALRVYDLIGDIKKIRLCIHQPRLDHYDEWTISRTKLLQFAQEAKTMAQKATRASRAFRSRVEEGAPCAPDTLDRDLHQPEESACRWCPAKAFCPELERKVSVSILDGFEDLTSLPAEDAQEKVEDSIRDMEFGDKDISKAFATLPLVKLWVKAVEDEVHEKLKRGEPVEGYKMIVSRGGMRKWNSTKKLQDFLAAKSTLRKASYLQEKLLSPAQLEKTIGKDNPRIWNQIKDKYLTKTNPSYAVVPEQDKRPAVSPAAFENLNETENK